MSAGGPVTVAGFLSARLDEDEESAEDVHHWDCDSVAPPAELPCNCGEPARVLREVAAKRAILARHRVIMRDLNPVCAWCSGSFLDDVALYAPCPDLLDLAAIWSDHPDYNPAWRP